MSTLEPEKMILPSELWIENRAPEFPVIQVQNEHATATIALHGAHVMEYTPKGQQPVLYMSPDTLFQEGKAIRGGVPLCWPWFNAHPTNPDLPSHGFARNRFWQLQSASNTPDYTEIVLVLETDTIAELPMDCSVQATIRVGTQLSIALTTTNLGKEACVIGGALHSYFAVADIEAITIHGLGNTAYTDTTNHTEHTQQGAISIRSEIDNVYHNTAHTILVKDMKARREIQISKTGSRSTVVWNPWVTKAQQLADLPNDGYQHFVCVEAANAHQDVRSLLPQESHTLETTIHSRSL